MSAINEWLDRLPRSRFGTVAGRETSAFRACGVAGFYAAVVVLMGGGIVTHRSLLVLAVLVVVCAGAFFTQLYVRKWLTGRESMVLLDQVWFAEACAAATLVAMHEPLAAYFDVLAVAACVFLAVGRVGCLLAGCCHGRPSSIGIVYQRSGRQPSTPHLAGVRLFPVQAIEALLLLGIGLVGFAALVVAEPGRVFIWASVAYGVARFGLEGLRGDARPRFLGLSQPRWMALALVAFALWLAEGADVPRGRALALWSVLGVVTLAAIAARWYFDLGRRVLAPRHLEELRRILEQEMTTARQGPTDTPRVCLTSLGVVLGVSLNRISLSLPAGHSDLALLCDVAVAAVPELIPSSARATDAVLHLETAPLDRDVHVAPRGGPGRGGALYGNLMRARQRERERSESPPAAGEPGISFAAGREAYFQTHASPRR